MTDSTVEAEPLTLADGRDSSSLGAGPSIDDLQPIGAFDIDLYNSAMRAGQATGFGYYLPGLLTYERQERRALWVGVDQGSVCVYRWRQDAKGSRMDLYLAPMPMDPAVLRRSLERINDYNGDRDGRVVRIDEKDRKAVEALGIDLKLRKRQFLYAPEIYRDLGGKALYTVRRNVARVEKMPGLEVVPYGPDSAVACKALLRRWRKEHQERHGTQGGFGTSRRILDLVGRVPDAMLTGQVIKIDREVVGFAFGGAIRAGLGCSFERKCELNLAGLSYFQLRSFLCHLDGFETVNDGSDVGRAGLNQLKHSFRPVALHDEFSGYQRA